MNKEHGLSFVDGKGQRVTLEWSVENGRFSMSGDCGSGCGQVQDSIVPANPAQAKLLAIWRAWHRNDMHAVCEHQDALGWQHGKDIALTPDTMTDAQMAAITERNGKRAEAEGEKEFAALVASFGKARSPVPGALIDAWTRLRPGVTLTTYIADSVRRGELSFRGTHTREAVEFLRDLRAEVIARHTKVPTSEIFKDCLLAPCPTCGYAYGSRWLTRPLPDGFESDLSDTIAEILEAEAAREAKGRKFSDIPEAEALALITHDTDLGEGRDAELCLALCRMNDLSTVDLNEIEIDGTSVTVQGADYLAGTDDEMDAEWDLYLDNYIDECILPEMKDKTLERYFDRDAWKKDARQDGRGHCLNSYDGNEMEHNVNGTYYFAYRR